MRLNFFRITRWRGDPHGKENQAFTWQQLGARMVEPMLPANAPVFASLALPADYAVTDSARFGLDRIKARLEKGLSMIQVRWENASFTREVVEIAHRHGCKVLTKEPFPGADGVHFTASQLKSLVERPKGLAAASVHTREELEHAMRLELDFAVLGPVKDKEPALGWTKFAEVARGTSIPVYAIGGLTRADREDAWRAGAHGLAMIRGAWG